MENKNCNIILINIDGFRKDKIDLCPSLKFLKENSKLKPLSTYGKTKLVCENNIHKQKNIKSVIDMGDQDLNLKYKDFCKLLFPS